MSYYLEDEKQEDAPKTLIKTQVPYYYECTRLED